MSERVIALSAEETRGILDGSVTEIVRHTINFPPTGPCRLRVKTPHWRARDGSYNDQVWDEWTRRVRWKGRQSIHDCGLDLDDNGQHIALTKRAAGKMPAWAIWIVLGVEGVRVDPDTLDWVVTVKVLEDGR